MNEEELKKKARELRKEVIKMLEEAGSGHTAGSLGMADIFAVLYHDHLNINPKKPESDDRDIVVLSNGHICPILYATLADKGFFPKKELKTFRKINSKLQGHPHRETLPGLETTSGPLGSGLSQASGIALGLKRDKKSNKVICLTSDGEHEEGNTWEAAMLAAKYQLSNLTQIIDRNNIQIDGNTEDIMPLNDLKSKYEAFNWHVQEINGNNVDEIKNALNTTTHVEDKPSVIIAHTTPGKGVSFIENDYKWHGKPPSEEEAKIALEELDNAQ